MSFKSQESISTYLYSNITCTATKIHKQANERNRAPAHQHKNNQCRGDISTKCKMRTFPSGEQSTKEVFHAICAYDETDKISGHHHKDIEDTANGADVAIPPFIAVLQKKSANKHVTSD